MREKRETNARACPVKTVITVSFCTRMVSFPQTTPCDSIEAKRLTRLACSTVLCLFQREVMLFCMMQLILSVSLLHLLSLSPSCQFVIKETSNEMNDTISILWYLLSSTFTWFLSFSFFTHVMRANFPVFKDR